MIIYIHKRHSRDRMKQSERCLSHTKLSRNLYSQCVLYTASALIQMLQSDWLSDRALLVSIFHL